MCSGRCAADQSTVTLHKKFYVSLILNDIIREVEIPDISRKFKVGRGLIQQLQTSASMFSAMVHVFAGRLGWTLLEKLLAQYQERFSFGVEPELIPLIKIPGMRGSQARALYKSGYNTIESIV